MATIDMTALGPVLSKVGDMSFRRRVLTAVEWLSPLPTGSLVLDAGCGEGFYEFALPAALDVRVNGFDHDPHLIEMARAWLADEPRATVGVGDIYAIDADDETYDAVICSEVLEHLPDDVSAVAEVFRVLKPGGLFVSTVPNANYPLAWDPLNWVREHAGLGHFNPSNGWLGGIWALDHQRLYTPQQFEGLIRGGGFKIREVRVLTRAGVPFNCMMLQVGKKVLSGPVAPESVRKASEKFETEEPLSPRHPFSVAMRTLRAVDRRNDRRLPLNSPALNVAILAEKPPA